MSSILTTLDLVIFFVSLAGAMIVGLIAGRKEDTSEDYFLAGKQIPWWGVAGSIFGSNVSANHMVGMMGLGFSVGFAQAHFELGAIAGLMVLCFGFLPVYRKLNLYTLSEYLGRRYDDRSRILYAVIMVIIMAGVQMVPGLYIGARSICFLMEDLALNEVVVTPDSQPKPAGATEAEALEAMLAPQAKTKLEVNMNYYVGFVIALAAISAAYTIFGGLKAVIWTDVIQSVLLLAAGLVVAWLTFDKLGGWGAMMAMDRAADGADKMHLYLPTYNEKLPWTGVFTGLMAMHCFYWGTNQFIVQRALGARSDREARLGIVAAGFLKLLIPFFAIAAGIAAFYLFRRELAGRHVAPDTAFTEVVKLVVPAGYGIIGVISAGLIGAILSSIDSMMNSCATIVSVDIYKRYIRPDASDRQMIRVARLSIVAFVVLAAVLAIFVINPNSEENFFLTIADYQNYLTPGILVAFVMGMFWRRSTADGAFAAILAGFFFSWLVVVVYNGYFGTLPAVSAVFGKELNFFHRVVVVILLCVIVHVLVSLITRRDLEKERLVWTDLGGHDPGILQNRFLGIAASIVVYAILGGLMVYETLTPTVAAWLGAAWTMAMFLLLVLFPERKSSSEEPARPNPLLDERTWAGLLCSAAVFMLFYFY